MAASTVDGLRWREETGEWQPVYPAPSANLGFRETGVYVFERPAPDLSLYVDDELLDIRPDAPLQSTWSPGFFAGEVTAQLLRPDGCAAATFLLDVSPDPVKAGRNLFKRMLDELWEFDPSLVIGTEPATCALGELGEEQDPWVALSRLRQHGGPFIASLTPIRRRPHRSLRYHRGSAPLHHVRRADRGTAMSLLNSPAIALFGDTDRPEAPSNGDIRLQVPVTEETLDTEANRTIKALTRAVLRRAAGLHSRLQRAIDREQTAGARTPLTARWPVRRQFLEELQAGLVRVLRQPPFVAVSDAAISAAGLTAVAAHPAYARAWNLGWRSVRTGLAGPPSTERTWISPTWEVYERWCFVRLGQQLSSAAPAWNWTRAAGPKPRWRGTWGGRHAELQLQPMFHARSESTDGQWSISRQRIPDIVLTVDGPEGKRFVVLDAKYRASPANVLDAMASAHIYQDSLRIGSQRPEASLLLVPAAGAVSHLEDQRFQSEHKVGVHPFSAETGGPLPTQVLRLFETAD